MRRAHSGLNCRPLRLQTDILHPWSLCERPRQRSILSEMKLIAKMLKLTIRLSDFLSLNIYVAKIDLLRWSCCVWCEVLCKAEISNVNRTRFELKQLRISRYAWLFLASLSQQDVKQYDACFSPRLVLIAWNSRKFAEKLMCLNKLCGFHIILPWKKKQFGKPFEKCWFFCQLRKS